MNKEFEYKGYKFNIKVELDTKVERRINGSRWHTVTTNCMDYDNYYDKMEIKDEFLETCVKNMEKKAKEYVDLKDYRGESHYENRLLAMGFK